MTTTQTFAIGRFRLTIAVDHAGRIVERWEPKLPVRLLADELVAYRAARAAFSAPALMPRGAPSKPTRAIAAEVSRQRREGAR